MRELLLETAPPKLHGELGRYMLQVANGLFAGWLSSPVREGLRYPVTSGARPRTAAVLLCAADTDQGFPVRYHGKPENTIQDFEGLMLVRPAN